jgi:AcrR family transcriptional regulator
VSGGEPILRSGRFAGRGERSALLIALAELTLARPYEDITADQIAARAGARPEAFDQHFQSKESCLLAAYDAVTKQAFAAASLAYVNSAGSWAEAVHQALGALLDFLAGTPAFTNLYAIETARAEKPLAEARDRALARFMEFLEPGFSEADEEVMPPRIASETIAGGFFELIRLHVVRGSIAALPQALPVATIVTLSPFVGLDEAKRIARGGQASGRSG